MARRPQFKDEDILEAARQVFLDRGMRATTAEVAERAGVSEGTLFHHFKSKEALFRAALNPKLADPPEIDALVGQVGRATVAENLTHFAHAVVDSLRVRLPFMMLAWSSAAPGQRPDLVCEFEPAYARLIRAAAAYVEGEMRLGRLRMVDAEIAARSFVGGLSDYVRTEIIRLQPHGLPLPAAMFVRGLVDLFIHGAGAPAVQRPRALHRSR